jgi:hypothetical protein
LRTSWKIEAIFDAGKYLVGVQKAVLRFFEAATGAALGDLEAPRAGDAGFRLFMLRAESKEATALLGKTGADVVRWDLATGKLLDSFALRVAPKAKAVYAGSRHLLLDDRDLFDLQLREIVWTYQFANPGQSSAARLGGARPFLDGR